MASDNSPSDDDIRIPVMDENQDLKDTIAG